MEKLGMIDAFHSQFNTIAERNLAAAAIAQQDPQAVKAVAVQFRTAESAQKAWQRLADRAWDRGQLGLYASWPFARTSSRTTR